ncbi:MAG: type I-F CRISPR-associated endoribonuclease Cas6/Csy4 [Burkholderiaceae bacterium]
MDYFVDIRVLPDPEFKETTLLNAVFAKLHRELTALKETGIGVSFPNASSTLGDKLRLHGSQNALEILMATIWLKGLRDYTQNEGIEAVPEGCLFRSVRRVQLKSSAARLFRRSLSKGWIDEDEAKQRVATAREKRTKLPYLQLHSQSTGQKFKLFIQQGRPNDSLLAGSFNAYGLSQTATVPAF